MGFILYLPLRMLTASPISYFSCIYLSVLSKYDCSFLLLLCRGNLHLASLVYPYHCLYVTIPRFSWLCYLQVLPFTRAWPSPGLPFAGPTLPPEPALRQATLPRFALPQAAIPRAYPSTGRHSPGLPFHRPTFPGPPFPGGAFRLSFLYRDRIVPFWDPLFAMHLLTTRSLSDAPVAGSPFFGTVCLPGSRDVSSRPGTPTLLPPISLRGVPLWRSSHTVTDSCLANAGGRLPWVFSPRRVVCRVTFLHPDWPTALWLKAPWLTTEKRKYSQ